MTLVGFVIDLIIVAVCLFVIFRSRKRGAVKTLMSLVSGIASLFVAYAFTPALSAFLKEKVFLEKLAESIMNTVASLAQSGVDAAQNAIYDVSKLIDNPQFLSVLDRYRADPGQTADMISGINDTSYAAVEKVSYAVAEPIAKVISDITAFALIFIVSLIVLKIVTMIVSAVFELPVLRTLDKTLGTVFGIVMAAFFVLVFAMIINNTADILTSAAPATFPKNFPQESLILRLLSKYNIIGIITEKISF
ncbi:MAG: CvpA family protein [Clostridia bacterium]|nr:CvpA family protein [Clostridia bacterium]